ncbi:MAG: PHP domain-containing protein [Nitrospirota bacterium]
MLKQFRADLHIHSCLSPCADLNMTPSRIVIEATSKELSIIGICDHNSAENLSVTKKVAREKDIHLIAGMEVTSSEEVHILALFDRIENVMALQEIVYANLSDGENDEEASGYQVVVNENDEILNFNKRLLIGATSLSVQNIVDVIRSLEGLAIASHIDREVFGIISQLGFIPDNLKLDALEISPRIDKDKALSLFKDYSHIPWVSFSDAHFLRDIGRRTTSFFIEEPVVAEIVSALKGIDGRRIEWGE